LAAVVHTLRDQYHLENITYRALKPLGDSEIASTTVVSTSSPEWFKYYDDQELIKIDPIVNSAWQSALPLDWDTVDRRSRNARHYFSEMVRFKIGDRGLTIPISPRNAPDRRKKQVFEMRANRGIYQNGWFASSMAFVPWQPDRQGFDIDKAKWELYNIDRDFSQADDLASQYPDKLRALQDLWWAEAARNNILPLDWRGPSACRAS
jgi:hypothetical protein